MHIFASRYTRNLTRWGVFTNLDPSAASRRDRADGYWYLDIHTPALFVRLHHTKSPRLSLTYWGRRRSLTIPAEAAA